MPAHYTTLRLRLPVVVPVCVTGDTTLGDLRMRAMHAAGTSVVTLCLNGGNGTALRDLQVQEGQRVVVGLPTPAAPQQHRCTAAMWHTVAAALESDPQAAASCGTDEGMALDLSLPGGEVVPVHVPVDATVGTLRLLAAHALKLRPAEATMRLAVLGNTIADDNATPLSQVGLEAGSTVAISIRLQASPTDTDYARDLLEHACRQDDVLAARLALGSKPHTELVRYLGQLPHAPVAVLRDTLIRADARTVAVLLRALVQHDEGQAVILLSGVLDRPGVLPRLLSEMQEDNSRGVYFWILSPRCQFLARNLERFLECDAFDDSAFMKSFTQHLLCDEASLKNEADPVALWQMMSGLGWHCTPRALEQAQKSKGSKELTQMLLADGVPLRSLWWVTTDLCLVTFLLPLFVYLMPAPTYWVDAAFSLPCSAQGSLFLLVSSVQCIRTELLAQPWAAHKLRCLYQRRFVMKCNVTPSLPRDLALDLRHNLHNE